MFEMAGDVVTKLGAMHAENQLGAILDDVPKDCEEEVGNLFEWNIPEISTFGDKVKIFKEAVGEEAFKIIASGPSLKEFVDEHIRNLGENEIKRMFECIKEIRNKYAPNKDLPCFKDFKNLIVLSSQEG